MDQYQYIGIEDKPNRPKRFYGFNLTNKNFQYKEKVSHNPLYGS